MFSSSFLPTSLLSLLLVSFTLPTDARLHPQHRNLGASLRHSTLASHPQPTTNQPLPLELGAGRSSLSSTRSVSRRAVDSSVTAGHTYLGCRADPDPRALTGARVSASSMTQTSCIQFCAGKGYSYSGTQGSDCSCGNFFDNGLGNFTTGCNTACPGDYTQTCGGSGKSTVWRDDSLQFQASSSLWNSLGCAIDGSARALTGYKRVTAYLTLENALSTCNAQGYTYAGLENGNEYYCGNALSNGLGKMSPNPQDCNVRCSGDSTQLCGAPYRLSLYSLEQQSGCPATSPYTPGSVVPSSPDPKFVFSHHIVGNTYPYVYNDWLQDITLAYNSGADGFALNLGTDDWQLKQVTSAYAAALAHGKGFKLFFSFDMSVWQCNSIPTTMVSYIAQFASHPNQYKFSNATFVSTFAGESCGDAAWVNLKTQLAKRSISIYFVPAFFGGTSWAAWKSIDGEFNWNSAWSMDANMITTGTDLTYMNALGPDKSYMAGVSPLFFTHYGTNSYNKNWLYQSDNWVFVVRWMQLISMRDKFDFVQQVSFNDYGESHYMGPIKGAQPNSQSWVDGFDHTVLLELNQYFTAAFKNGKYPTITTEKIYLQARPHLNTAVATADSAGAPPTLGQNGPQGQTVEANNFFVLIFATSPATVILSSGSMTTTSSIGAGISRLSSPLMTGQGMRARLVRGSRTCLDLQPDYTFADTTTEYNFNYRFFSSVSS